MVSAEEYERAAEALLSVSDSLGAGWHALNTTNARQHLCLGLRQVLRLSEDSGASEVCEEATAGGELATFTYHVIFNEAFSVPQLLFLVTKTNGSLIPLSLLHKSIPAHLVPAESDSYLWETLSQIEHPVLHRPFFALHPCRTAELIGNMKTFSKNWLISWISSVGPAVGLQLPVAFAN
ncbi:ubiquitin-like-conjugating enzyme ATG10 [Paramacrobiotus metropolitanus]|uniref:ubiquitin-like-conjugating enzyme ATG10 n=1 Tax=Paramacrobiotus metropolitanus TaxID=2943436 RepID=UPI00244638D6|nr:ubiquitin-like-conjugating enzyme ATG10 [Paramacrobiotus metropolitanus]